MEPLIRDTVIYVNLLVLINVGITLTYMTSKVPNFAQGTFVAVGIYTSFTTAEIFKANVYFAAPLSFLLGGAASYLMYRLVIAPQIKRNASVTALIMTTIAIDVLFIGILNIYADYAQYVWKILSRSFLLREFDFQLAGEPGVFFVAPALVIALVIVLHISLTRTRFGTAMRAAVVNPALASVLGIDVQLVYGVSWFLAGGLAGVAGSLFSLWFQGSTDAPFGLLVSAFSASILGGLLSIYGAFLGGYIIGLSETLGTILLADAVGMWIIGYRTAIPLAIMVLTLLIIPGGITSVNLRDAFRKKHRGRTHADSGL